MAQIMHKNFTNAMRLLGGLTRKNNITSVSVTTRTFSAAKTEDKKVCKEEDIKKSIFISQSTDIFTNLALEDWIYKNWKFDNQHILMLWRNDPCVVIGRHQNPWLEANIPYLTEQGIPLARRNSGGGTVYHDRGNVNLTFFTTKENYNRRYNLELITRALFREYSLKSDINERQDIVVQQKFKQISGTAAKLGRPSAYHHCTILVNANKAVLSQALAKHETGISTNATQSVRSPIANLCEENTRVTVDGLQTAIGWEYLRTPALHIADGGQELIGQQKGFQYVNPTEEWFPGIKKLRDEYASWDWRFGKTPTFDISRSFNVPSKLLPIKSAVPQAERDSQQLSIKMTVEKGLIADVTLTIPPGFTNSGFHGEASVVTHLKGKKFSTESLEAVQEALQTQNLTADPSAAKKLGEREQFVANCFNQVVNTL